MFQILYFEGGVRKLQKSSDFVSACQDALKLDNDGHFLSEIQKLNASGEVIKTVWELRDDENTQEAFKRLRAIASTLNSVKQ